MLLRRLFNRMRPLPYRGYSWPLTQHAAGFREEVLRPMLTCALPFEGQADAQSEITTLMGAAGILTKNVRDGKDDAWRDYQQLPAELGLIYSTKVSRQIRLTDVAKSFVAGDISYPLMMTAQVLRYQYPNGQKYTLQAALRSDLEGTAFAKVDNQIDLHLQVGILVKPALLILRVLHTLQLNGEEPALSVDEIRACILPSRSNDEWPICVEEIRTARRLGSDLRSKNPVDRTRRNLQDWLKLLGQTLFFDTDGSSAVSLSVTAMRNLEQVLKVLNLGEDPADFWLPSGSSQAERIDWFNWYGDIAEQTGALELVSSESDSDDHTGSNLSAPADIEDNENEETELLATAIVTLSEVDEEQLLRPREFAFSGNLDAMAQSVLSGAIKRHAKALLHDEMVAEFAAKFRKQGATVLADPNSVDLLVKWGDQAALFEAKTVTAKNIQSRLRLALGQVEEYSYRLKHDHGIEADRAIIINRKIDASSWRADFFTNHMNVGLISHVVSGSKIIPPRSCSTCRHW